MVVRVGYKNRLVEVKNGFVYLFDGKLWSAPLERVVGYYLRGDEALPRPLREIAGDVYRVLLERGEMPLALFESGQRYGETTAS
jgi:hypothetical protein